MVPHEALLLLLVPHNAIHYSHHDHSPAVAPEVHVKHTNKPTNALFFTPENVSLNYWHSLMYNFNADTKKKYWYYIPSMQQTGLHINEFISMNCRTNITFQHTVDYDCYVSHIWTSANYCAICW